MRVLVVSQHYWPEPFNIADVCETLVERGHEVVVLTGLPNYPKGRVPEEYRRKKNREQWHNGVQIIRASLIERRTGALRRIANYVSFAWCASREARRIDSGFDAVLVNQTSPVLMALPAYAYRKAFGTQVLLWCVDIWPECLIAGGIPKRSFAYRMMLVVSQRIYKAADQVCVTSPLFKEYFTDVLGIDSSEIRVLSQYAEDIFAVESEASSTGSGVALDSSRCNLVFAGNVGAAQSVETIIRAAAQLSDNEHIVFHIVGDGSSLDSCKSLVKQMGVNNVVFHGRRPLEDMPAIYRQADGMLLTFADDPDNLTLRYTIPRKFQSYAAAGKPIIAAADGVVATIVGDEGCGLCCNAGDAETLARLCAEFATNENRAEMGSRARALYEREYSKERFFEMLEKELETVGEKHNAE